MKLDGIATLVSRNLLNPELDFWHTLCRETKEALSSSQKLKIEKASNEAWFLDKIAASRSRYLEYFQQILSDKYFAAWCGLERIEIESASLLRNPFCDTVEFKVDKLLQMVYAWQALFPYKLFFSPALLHKRVECNLCGKVRNPWSECRHTLGRVYGGRECIEIVTEVDLLEISVVTDPVQKYSVAFPDQNGNKIDNYNYDLVRFVADRLRSPFDEWRMYWTRAYHPHHLYPHLGADDGCPCDSGRAFKDCCKNAPGILRPHAEIVFEKDPSLALPNIEITGYAAISGGQS